MPDFRKISTKLRKNPGESCRSPTEIVIIIIIFIYLASDVISQEKTATSSRSITKASKYAIPLKPTHKLAESKRYLVTW